ESIRTKYYNQFLARGRIRFEEDAVRLLASKYDSIMASIPAVDTVTGARLLDLSGKYPQLSPEQKRAVIVHSAFGDVTIGDFIADVEQLDAIFRPRLRNAEDVRQYVQTLALRPAIDSAVHAERIGTLTYVQRDLMDRRDFILAER